jgi:hypothetical protein
MPVRLTVVLSLVLLTTVAGCDADDVALPPADVPPPIPVATAYDPATCGRVEGRVTWSGPMPEVQQFIYGYPKGDGNFEVRMMPNPHAPQIDPTSKAVGDVVVYLRGIDPARAKPWDLPPVRVDLVGRQIVVRQGDDAPRGSGFVRRGDAVTIKSAESVFHVLRARGAAYFSTVFPDPEKPLTRTLDRAGRVELSSGAGYYWASADLFVDDHPYYTRTDPDGRFTFDRVQPGPVEVIVRLPSWQAYPPERDPETGLPTRMHYLKEIGGKAGATVTTGQTVSVTMTLP